LRYLVFLNAVTRGYAFMSGKHQLDEWGQYFEPRSQALSPALALLFDAAYQLAHARAFPFFTETL
jgi:hypothetical protein